MVPDMKRSNVRTGRTHAGLCLCAALALCVLATGCRGPWGGLDIERQTQTFGEFKSTGWSLTILGWDLPRHAMQNARDNIADARLDNVQVEEASLRPHFGYFDWILEILSVRYAKIEGTWGYRAE